ncbi:hypothetical protein EJ06DRAFT_533024 [Trichodelitschia bisporula]|uniref:Uncharacterized protein n=1 Tax=Trichodelitschia bisporula TaxID=703511 RepID=A0A6G1HN38_9PEZI|nr:hypothetical protein EJ06DRAFT_533024 [Trichodelitschia bisporula]
MADLRAWEEDRALYLFTSLTAGSSHIVTATSRIETILKNARIPFTYIDTATNEGAKRLFQRRANGRKLPLLVKDGFVIGDLAQVEEWNEFGELKEAIGDVPITATSHTTTPAKMAGPYSSSPALTPSKPAAVMTAANTAKASPAQARAQEAAPPSGLVSQLRQAAQESAAAAVAKKGAAKAGLGSRASTPAAELKSPPLTPGGRRSSGGSVSKFIPDSFEKPATTHRGSDVGIVSEEEIREIERRETICEEDEESSDEEDKAKGKAAVKKEDKKPAPAKKEEESSEEESSDEDKEEESEDEKPKPKPAASAVAPRKVAETKKPAEESSEDESEEDSEEESEDEQPKGKAPAKTQPPPKKQPEAKKPSPAKKVEESSEEESSEDDEDESEDEAPKGKLPATKKTAGFATAPPVAGSSKPAAAQSKAAAAKKPAEESSSEEEDDDEEDDDEEESEDEAPTTAKPTPAAAASSSQPATAPPAKGPVTAEIERKLGKLKLQRTEEETDEPKTGKKPR